MNKNKIEKMEIYEKGYAERYEKGYAERYAEYLYNYILKKIVEPILGNKSTYLSNLNKLGQKILGSKFHGVYASDRIPKLTQSTPYAILNLDKTGEPGSHWVSVAKTGNNTFLYDSFARKSKIIIPSLFQSGNGKIKNIDISDVEQRITEENCGSRAISFLLLFDKWGEDVAKLI